MKKKRVGEVGYNLTHMYMSRCMSLCPKKYSRLRVATLIRIEVGKKWKLPTKRNNINRMTKGHKVLYPIQSSNGVFDLATCILLYSLGSNELLFVCSLY